MQDLLNRFPTSQPIEKKYEILTVDSPKNKESKKSNDTQLWARMRENQSKQGNAFIKQGWTCRTCWTGSQMIQPVNKNYEILTVDSQNNK